MKIKIADVMISDFSVVDAGWSRKRALDITSAVDKGYVVVRQAMAGHSPSEFYLLGFDEFQKKLRESPAGRIASILNLAGLTPAPTLFFSSAVLARFATHAVVLDGDKPVGVVAPAEALVEEVELDGAPPTTGDDDGEPPSDGEPPNDGPPPPGRGGGSGPPGVARSLIGTMPPAAEVNKPIEVAVTLTSARKASGGNIKTFVLPVGTKIDVVVRAREPLRIVGKFTDGFEVTDPQTDVSHTFVVTADTTGVGRVEIDAFHNGMNVGSIEVTTNIVATMPAVAVPAKPQQASLRVVKRTPPDLSLIIFEDSNEIRFLLNTADGSQNNVDYPPLKLRTPREYFQEFFRTIENLPPASAKDQLRTQGLNLFRTAVPEALQKTLWDLRGSVKTVQINSDEPWIPWEVCKLAGVTDGEEDEGLFFAEAFSITRWFRRIPAVSEITLDKIALVVPNDSGLTSAPSEQAYMKSLRTARRLVVDVDPTRNDVTQAMQGGQFDGWHFTGHARASVTLDADKSPIDLRKPEKLMPTDIAGKTLNMLKTNPFIFLNACQSAQGAMSLTGVGGWAQRFIKVPAGRPSAAAFVGTYWSVDDAKAFAFAKALYGRLLAGMAIGQAAQEARLVVEAENEGAEVYDPSWLAYTVYADPSATVVQR